MLGSKGKRVKQKATCVLYMGEVTSQNPLCFPIID